jgi:alanyl-tRNA synthetase
MGAVGPCGPCSEVHFDRIGERNAANLVNKDDPNVLEIWNIVFIAFNRAADSSLRRLPASHIDMGLGFERLVSCLQGKSSNYDTDIFTPLIKRIQDMTGARAYAGRMGTDDVDGVDTAYRVLADHVSLPVTTSMLGTNGMSAKGPHVDVCNLGRLHSLQHLRRGAHYASSKLGVKIGTFFSTLSTTVVEEFVSYYIPCPGLA